MDRKYYKYYDYSPAIPTIIEEKQNKTSGIPEVLENILSGVKIDDIIIVALIVLLITEEKPDYITILALAYILFF